MQPDIYTEINTIKKQLEVCPFLELPGALCSCVDMCNKLVSREKLDKRIDCQSDISTSLKNHRRGFIQVSKDQGSSRFAHGEPRQAVNICVSTASWQQGIGAPSHPAEVLLGYRKCTTLH